MKDERERERVIFHSYQKPQTFFFLSPFQRSKPSTTVMISIVHKFNMVSVGILAVFIYLSYISDFCT